MTSLPLPVAFLLLITAISAALFDLWRRRIPNWLVVSGAAAGFAVNSWLGGLAGARTAAAGFAVALAVYIPLFAIRAMGAGDVKLMAAVGAFTGPINWLILFLLTALAGGILALALVIWKGRLGETLRNVGTILGELARLRAPYEKKRELDVRDPRAVTLPHGVVIAVGTILFLAI